MTGTLHKKVYRSNYVIILFIPDFDKFVPWRLPGVVSGVGVESVGRGGSARAWRVATRVSRGQLEMLENPSKALLDKGNDPLHKATRQLEDETSHLAPHQQHAPT
ncbi:unnamed protein product, partial [Cuscuta campestris]